MARTAYFTGPTPRVLAHRGLSQHKSGIDENSLAAFEEAILHGATHIESDVHATKDGVAVLFHDHDLKRVAGIDAPIASLSFQELSEIRLSHGGTVPSLEQVLRLNVKLNLDIKSSAAVVPTVRAIEQNLAHERVLVSSFSSVRRRQALRLLTQPVATSASMREVILSWISASFGGIGFGAITNGLDAFQIPTKQGPIRFATPRFVSLAQRHGLEVHFWTINDPEQMKELLALGADGIVSDRIDLMR